MQSATSDFRTDIQALRAVAVLLVLVYHYFPTVMPGGYLGVDVFFVISGFLITRLIIERIDAGRFTLADFYFRRARRILPASLVVVFATSLLAPWFQTEEQIAAYGPQVWGALTFSINFVLWGQSGYFDAGADTKPLLHFWSLAVEEQYYIVIPFLLLLTARRWRLAMVLAIVALGVVSTVLLYRHDPGAAFYMLPSRAWELGLGSLGSLVVHRVPGGRSAGLLAVPAVAALLVIALWPIGGMHPGPDAAVACIATLVILLVGIPGRAFRRQPLSGLAPIGNISYSLYLVHWPVLVFTESAFGQTAPLPALLAALALSFVLAAAMYRYIEQPFRTGFQVKRSRLVAGLVSVSVALAAAPPILNRVAESDIDYDHLRRQNLAFPRSCAFGERFTFDGVLNDKCRSKPGARIMVWGDSYARAWTTALLEPLAEPGVELLAMARCEALTAMSRLDANAEDGQKWGRSFSESCIDFNRSVLDYAISSPEIEIVVLAGRFQGILSPTNIMLSYEDGGIREYATSGDIAVLGLGRTVEALRAAGKRVVIIAPPPADGSNIGDCWERNARGLLQWGGARSCDLPLAEVTAYRAETYDYLAEVGRRFDVDVINMNEFFCDDRACRIEIDRTLMFRDAGHLTVDGSVLVGRRTDIGDRVLRLAR